LLEELLNLSWNLVVITAMCHFQKQLSNRLYADDNPGAVPFDKNAFHKFNVYGNSRSFYVLY